MSLRNLCIAPRLIPISSDIFRMEKPFFLSSVICFLMDDVRTDFRPNLVPFAIVRAIPALVLSMSISRFHSSRTPMSFINMRPELDTVSKPFLTAITPTPLIRRTRITLNRIRYTDGLNSFQRFNGKEQPFLLGLRITSLSDPKFGGRRDSPPIIYLSTSSSIQKALVISQFLERPQTIQFIVVHLNLN